MRLLDWLAHLLYEPASLGRRVTVVRSGRLRRVHLIPGSWLERVCDRYDRSLGLTEDEMRRTS